MAPRITWEWKPTEAQRRLFEEWRNFTIGYLVSSREGVNIRSIPNFLEESTGEEIPLDRMGFRTINQFIYEMADCVETRTLNGKFFVFIREGAIPDSMRNIRQLVLGQAKDKGCKTKTGVIKRPTKAQSNYCRPEELLVPVQHIITRTGPILAYQRPVLVPSGVSNVRRPGAPMNSVYRQNARTAGQGRPSQQVLRNPIAPRFARNNVGNSGHPQRPVVRPVVMISHPSPVTASRTTSAAASRQTATIPSRSPSTISSRPPSTISTRPMPRIPLQVMIPSQPTSTATSRQNSTIPPQPTSTATSRSNSTILSQPTSTATSGPNATVLSQPTSTATSRPNATVLSQPTSTSTSRPNSTIPPQPTSTITSRPNSTMPSQPTSTIPTQPTSTTPTQPTSTTPTQPTSTIPTQPASTIPSVKTSTATARPLRGITLDTDCVLSQFIPNIMMHDHAVRMADETPMIKFPPFFRGGSLKANRSLKQYLAEVGGTAAA